MMSASDGGGGSWRCGRSKGGYSTINQIQMQTRGEGVKKSENFVDITSRSPLRTTERWDGRRQRRRGTRHSHESWRAKAVYHRRRMDAVRSTEEREEDVECGLRNRRSVFLLFRLAGWQFNRLFVCPRIGPSFGPSVKLKRSYVQTARRAILWAQNNGLRIGPTISPRFGPRF